MGAERDGARLRIMRANKLRALQFRRNIRGTRMFLPCTQQRGTAMTARSIEKQDWAAFCATVSKALEGSQAEVEVESLDLGDQVEKDWAPWIGITYDPKDDIIDIALDDDVDHIINRPRDLVADIDDVNISALQITDADGRRHLVRLRDGLFLPAPR
jgi:hypothetical protein